MSSARTKNRFGENISRPTTANMRRRPAAKNSESPVNRSVSESRHFGDDILAITPTDISVKSEDFIDALDESLKMDSKDGDKPDSRLCSITRKNSSSGIPRAVSGNKSKTAVKPCISRNNSPNKMASRISNGPSSIPRKTSSSPVAPSSPNNNRRTLELQFITKKKKLDLMKRELLDKQKPIVELYHTLQQLKKKLDECGGKPVVLEALKFLENESAGAKHTAEDISRGGGEHLLNAVNLDSDLMVDMKNSMRQIPASLLALCKSLMAKRSMLLDILEKASDPFYDKSELKLQVEALRDESISLDELIDDIFSQQDIVIEGLINKLSRLLTPDEQPKKILESKIKKQENDLRDLNCELEKMKLELESKNNNGSVTNENHGKLSDKISILEKQIDADKKKHATEVDKYRSFETNMKNYKIKVKEFETSRAHSESKIAQLMQDIRNMQQKQKTQAQSFEKEISDLNKSRHLDKTVIEKLTKDKSTFEIRIRMANENTDSMRQTFEERITELLKDLHTSRDEAQVTNSENERLRQEYEELHKQLNKMEVQTQQAVDMIHTKHEHEGDQDPNAASGETISDSRECELKIEVVAQRATIRSLQDKCDANAAEKLRFISTIEKMNGTSVEISDSIVKELVKKEEIITRYDLELKKNEDLIARQKMEIEKLHVSQKHLVEQMQGMSVVGENDDIKKMLRDGKAKLGEALKKSLEDEHKIIRYEHELAQKMQDINNLENLLKVRDGLIGVVKAKKDEILMENHSLTKYSEEIRNYVLKAKEELIQKNEVITEQQLTLDQKLKEVRHLEKRVADLEEKLSLTNERRYKLQDTVSYMEKELQATKAQAGFSQPSEVQTRYEFGRKSTNFDRQITLKSHWSQTSHYLYQRYKAAYEKEKREKYGSRNVADETKNDAPCKPEAKEWNSIVCEPSRRRPFTKRVTFESTTRPRGTCSDNTVHTGGKSENETERYTFIENVKKLAMFDNPSKVVLGVAGKDCRPALFKRVDRYKISDSGNILWGTPTYRTKHNNMLVSKDMIAHSCDTIREHLDDKRDN